MYLNPNSLSRPFQHPNLPKFPTAFSQASPIPKHLLNGKVFKKRKTLTEPWKLLENQIPLRVATLSSAGRQKGVAGVVVGRGWQGKKNALLVETNYQFSSHMHKHQ